MRKKIIKKQVTEVVAEQPTMSVAGMNYLLRLSKLSLAERITCLERDVILLKERVFNHF